MFLVRRKFYLAIAVLALVAGLNLSLPAATSPPPAASSVSVRPSRTLLFPPAQAPSTVSASGDVLKRYCVSCHNERLKTGGLALDTIRVDQVGEHAATWEKVVRKLRTGSMPPAGRPRPQPSEAEALVTALENALDAVANASPNAGRPADHRLNRTEYGNVIRDLLAVDIDPAAYLPADDADLGFDNMADILSISPALLERAMFAARKISRLAVGDPTITSATDTYVSPKMRFQDDLMDEDLPFGSRGGMAIRHYFPLDADYDLRIVLRRQLYDYVRGLVRPQQLEVRVDGALVKTFTVGGAPGTPPPATFAGANFGDREWEDYVLHADDGLTVRFKAKAGPRLVGVSFVQARSVRDGVMQPRAGGKLLAIAERWSSPSEALEAAVERVIVSGPYSPTGSGDTSSRRRIFVCQPTRASDEEPCARTILGTLARRAFRRPLAQSDIDTLLGFFEQGRKHGGFERGIQRGIEAILVDPEFLYRVERDPPTSTAAPARISDIELASRLSFFLWSSIPDDDLLAVAEKSKLSDPKQLEHQTRRMLADPRSKAIVQSFARQWLGLRKLRSVAPEPEFYTEWDENLRESFQQETELFVESQLREDRSVVDLIAADYSYLNERLARHYGVPNVYGSRLRRVTFSDGRRGGLLGQGSILTLTSYPTRTSPVLRGHWLLEAILGSPPPPPPPNIPPLPDRGEGGKAASVRERLEQHRNNPVCAACHAPMDPLGFALENFDAIGMWRTIGEGGRPIDATGELPGGKQFDGLAGLKATLLGRREQFVETVTEKLLTYALGRGVEYYDMPAVRRILREAAPDYRWSSLILGIVNSTPFQMRQRSHT